MTVEGISSSIVFPFHSETQYNDGLTEVRAVAEGIRTNLHALHYAMAMSLELVRGGGDVIHERRGVDVIHAHDWMAGLAAVILKETFEIPMLLTTFSTEVMRGGRTNLLSESIYQLESEVFSKAELLLVPKERAYESLIDDYSVDPGKLLKIPENGLLASKLVAEVYREVIPL